MNLRRPRRLKIAIFPPQAHKKTHFINNYMVRSTLLHLFCRLMVAPKGELDTPRAALAARFSFALRPTDYVDMYLHMYKRYIKISCPRHVDLNPCYFVKEVSVNSFEFLRWRRVLRTPPPPSSLKRRCPKFRNTLAQV